jgi:hypothetical protein
MRNVWNSRLRRVLWLWFFAVALGIFVMGAAGEYGETGGVGWRRILWLVVAVLMNAQAIWDALSPTAESSAPNTTDAT